MAFMHNSLNSSLIFSSIINGSRKIIDIIGPKKFNPNKTGGHLTFLLAPILNLNASVFSKHYNVLKLWKQ